MVKQFIEDNCPRLWLHLKASRNTHRFERWVREGRPMPPPHVVKQRIVAEYAEKSGMKTFVETGTYKCEMLFSVRNRFASIYSIEFDEAYRAAAQRALKRYSNVSVLGGDSGQVLRDLVRRVPGPCLFWLDAHSIPGIVENSPSMTPIQEEIDAILTRSEPRDVILVDDARHFTGTHGWPTVATIRNRVLSAHSDWTFEVRDDVMRAHQPW